MVALLAKFFLLIFSFRNLNFTNYLIKNKQFNLLCAQDPFGPYKFNPFPRAKSKTRPLSNLILAFRIRLWCGSWCCSEQLRAASGGRGRVEIGVCCVYVGAAAGGALSLSCHATHQPLNYATRHTLVQLRGSPESKAKHLQQIPLALGAAATKFSAWRCNIDRAALSERIGRRRQ